MSKGRKWLTTLSLVAAVTAIAVSQAAATNITVCGTHGAGSYTLANSITLGVSGNCLIFNAGPVTLDLNGFTLSGSGFTNGVLALNISNVTVRNGTIKGFARSVNLFGGTGAVVENVRAQTGTNANGITVGDNSTVEGCLVTGHTAGGIAAGKNAIIVGNTLTGNTGNIITVSDGSLVKGNTVTLNNGNSATAIQVTQNSKVVDNIVSTSAFGISASGDHNVFSGNTISGCVEGMSAGNNTIVTGNNSSNNTDNGLEAGTDCLISGNTFNNNTGVGVTSDVRTVFLNNVANNNGNFGIHVNQNSSAIANVTDANGSSGLEVTCPSKIAQNTAIGNGTPNLDESGLGCLNTDNLAL